VAAVSFFVFMYGHEAHIFSFPPNVVTRITSYYIIYVSVINISKLNCSTTKLTHRQFIYIQNALFMGENR
jgi:hypothetical protein